mmetsp:Transcript_3102/g.8983  ORF Transcript_3102/g.8983 Transcript_3102/m.8983 type:complete len:307 (-) Transcript_3102:162-1082(-)
MLGFEKSQLWCQLRHLTVETSNVRLEVSDVLQLAQSRPLRGLPIGYDAPAQLLATTRFWVVGRRLTAAGAASGVHRRRRIRCAAATEGCPVDCGAGISLLRIQRSDHRCSGPLAVIPHPLTVNFDVIVTITSGRRRRRHRSRRPSSCGARRFTGPLLLCDIRSRMLQQSWLRLDSWHSVRCRPLGDRGPPLITLCPGGFAELRFRRGCEGGPQQAELCGAGGRHWCCVFVSAWRRTSLHGHCHRPTYQTFTAPLAELAVPVRQQMGAYSCTVLDGLRLEMGLAVAAGARQRLREALRGTPHSFQPR